MLKQPPRENIVLIGFMGSGKSTVGRLLARRLRFRFLDTDQIVEQRSVMRIPLMFERYGEEYFRQRETAALESLIGGSPGHVYATGGGIVTRPENTALLRDLGWVVQLKACDDEIFSRVSRNQKRPLLRVPDPRKKMDEILQQRRPLYDAVAQFTVDSTGLSHEEVVQKIIREALNVFGWEG